MRRALQLKWCTCSHARSLTLVSCLLLGTVFVGTPALAQDASCPGFNCPEGSTKVKFEWDDNFQQNCGGFVVEINGEPLMDGTDRACFTADAAGAIDKSQYDGFNLPVIITSVTYKEDNEISSATYESRANYNVLDGWYKAGPSCEAAANVGDFGKIESTVQFAISHVVFCADEGECPIPNFEEKVIRTSAPGQVELRVWDDNGNGISGVDFVDGMGNPHLVNFTVSSVDGLMTSTDGIHWTPTGPGMPDEVKLLLTQLDTGNPNAEYFARVTNGCGAINHIDPFKRFDAPESFVLARNFPNPFNPSTTISFQLAESAPVSLVIYDATGREVTRLLANQDLDAGLHEIQWNG